MLFTLRQTTTQSGPNFPPCRPVIQLNGPELTATVAEPMAASETLNWLNLDSPAGRTNHKQGCFLGFLETAADSSLSCCFNINPSGVSEPELGWQTRMRNHPQFYWSTLSVYVQLLLLLPLWEGADTDGPLVEMSCFMRVQFNSRPLKRAPSFSKNQTAKW